jgi:BlaI family transcriptional regulator, penicillinase repressor
LIAQQFNFFDHLRNISYYKGVLLSGGDVMARKNLPQPTEAELEILQILWETGTCTVRQVNDRQNTKREVGYTTTLKIMQIMADKRLLKRDKKGRSHEYRASYKAMETRKQLLDHLLETAFGGSVHKLVLHALGNHRISRQEIMEIQKAIDTMEGEES